MRDVESAIISHEQTQSNRVCCFQTLHTAFPKYLFSDYSVITKTVVLPCGGPKKTPLHIDILLLCLHFLVFWDCRVLLFGNRVSLSPGLGVRDVATALS